MIARSPTGEQLAAPPPQGSWLRDNAGVVITVIGIIAGAIVAVTVARWDIDHLKTQVSKQGEDVRANREALIRIEAKLGTLPGGPK